jgi:outer membrane lipoprotein-sorting protein
MKLLIIALLLTLSVYAQADDTIDAKVEAALAAAAARYAEVLRP